MSQVTSNFPSPAIIEAFQTALRGELILPTADNYDTARQVYNGMIDRRPGAIVRCTGVADVLRSVTFAREHGLTLAVRGGGHNGGGLGTCDDGLVIDLSPMKGIRVDPIAQTVRVEGGCTWGDVDHATHAFGMATPSGIISSTGVGGLTLGGGLGHLTRKCGLTIDNLLEADVVLADGSFVTVNEQSHPDLFWAIRGGGGNFGVVTSFLFRLHPISTVIAGPMLWPLDRAKEVMQWYRDFIPSAPHDLNGFFAFLVVPPGPPFPEELHMQNMCGIVWCHTGAEAAATAALQPARALAPALDLVGPLPHPALQGMFDALYPSGLQWYWKADFVQELPDAAIDLHVEHGAKVPTLFSAMHLYPIDGAAQAVAADATAWANRDARWAQVMVAVDSAPDNMDQHIAWVRGYWDALHPYATGGAYVNFMMDDEGQERVKATYRRNYARLVAVKNQYDPTNLFHINQNIKPTVTA
ncbi:MAG: FAD-binding oxidoreductase [Caldilineaceae bacterium]